MSSIDSTKHSRYRFSQPMPPADFVIRFADFDDATDQHAVLALLDMYSREPLGGGTPLALDVQQRLIPDLRRQPNCRTFLAFHTNQPVGW